MPAPRSDKVEIIGPLLSAVSSTVARAFSPVMLLLMSFGLEARATVEDDDIRGPRPAVKIPVP